MNLRATNIEVYWDWRMGVMLHTLVYSCTYPHVIPYTKYMLICYLELKVSFLFKKILNVYI